MQTVSTATQRLWEQKGQDIANYAILLRGPYSQRELSIVLHVKQQSISDWEAGLVRPMAKQLRGLLTHFIAWYETDRIEYAANLALNLLPPKKALTAAHGPDRSHAAASSRSKKPRTLRRT